MLIILNIKKRFDRLAKDNIIYHYTSSYIAINYILSDETLKFNLIRNTDDPIEYKDKIIGEYHSSNLLKRKKNIIKKIKNSVKEKIKNVKFISFSKNGDKIEKIYGNLNITNDFYLKLDYQNEFQNLLKSFGCNLPRMWSQYGEGHKGVCLVFDLNKIKKEIENKIKGKNHIKYYTGEINYRFPPVIKPSKLILDGNEMIKRSNFSNKYIDKNIDEIFFSKHINYKDEKEYRIILYDPKNKLNYINISKCLQGIILGEKFPKKYMEKIKEIVEKRDIFYKRVSWLNGYIQI